MAAMVGAGDSHGGMSPGAPPRGTGVPGSISDSSFLMMSSELELEDQNISAFLSPVFLFFFF